MLSFKKIIYASLFFISACGFNPVYTDSNSSKLLGQISIQEPNTQNDFIFYSQLIDRFGDRGDKYTLSYAISTSTEDKALDFDGTVHRVEISGSVLFNLKESGKWYRDLIRQSRNASKLLQCRIYGSSFKCQKSHKQTACSTY